MANKLYVWGDGLLGFHCPGCKFGHSFNVTKGGNRPVWTWNGSMEKPTFAPSLLVNGHDPATRCHSYVTDGKIQFLADCFHGLKGQTVDLPDYDEKRGD